jgi:uncharacterized membrane protein required for colicin V production
MVQLSTLLFTAIIVFAIVGTMRGWTKEIVSTAGIILALFATWQFDGIILQPLTRGASPDQIFFLYAGILVLVALFAYQTPAAIDLIRAREEASRNRRAGCQERLLGLIIGGVNGYLLFGSLWYYLDRTGYPFAPFVFAPAPGSQSAGLVETLPLVFLVQGQLLTVLVIVLFLFVIVTML